MPIRIEVFYEEEPSGWYGCLCPLMLTGLSEQLPAPKGKRRGLFYFTKLGFEIFGKPTLEQIQQENIKYRIIRLTRKMLHITYQDKYQLMGYVKRGVK
jgi:hypothetical protein